MGRPFGARVVFRWSDFLLRKMKGLREQMSKTIGNRTIDENNGGADRLD
jgi:hypothetical protein